MGRIVVLGDDGVIVDTTVETGTESINPSHSAPGEFVAPEFRALETNPQSVLARVQKVRPCPGDQFLNWRWQMGQQVVDAEGSTVPLSPNETAAFASTKSQFHAGVTPYYEALMNPDPDQPCPIRLQALPRLEELDNKYGMSDPLDEVPHSPVKEVVQVYPDRVAFCVAQLCPVYCRYCFRKRRDGEDGLHYNRQIIDRGIDYIAKTPAIRDVLVTGGDPFIASDQAIINLARRLYEIPHVEMIRFGTRTPVTLPYRVTKKLAQSLAEFHPVFVNTHFNCVEEITPDAQQAIANLVDAGIPVGNQSVLLKGVNDQYDQMMALLRGLLKMRVRPYYLFHPHLVDGTDHLRVSLAKGIELMRSIRGNITGMGIPSYIVDTPAGKVPITPEHALKQDGEDLILIDPRGEIWRERAAFI